MKKPLVRGLLVVVDLLLLAWLFVGVRAHSSSPARDENQTAAARARNRSSSATNESQQQRAGMQNKPVQRASSASTAFAEVYSSDPNRFVANLRAIRCPEETIKDILSAEVHRRFQSEEEALRSTPADHVPFSWSARTAEPRLLERRQKAAALAHEQSALLHSALSCEMNVPLPLYALTSSDQQLDYLTAESPNACSVREIQDEYWTGVRALQERTKGFWLRADLAELEQLKARRKQALAFLLPGQ